MKKIFEKNLDKVISFFVMKLKKKFVIAYPTESFFGLGCDPDSKKAVLRLLNLKKRSINKGLILVAENYIQLLPYIDENKLSDAQRIKMFNSWPGPISWIVPKSSYAPTWLTGCFNSIAIRVSDHPIIKKICIGFGKPLVSSSANLFGTPPCHTRSEVKKQFGIKFPILPGKNGSRLKPSEIRDVITDNIIRPG